MAHNTSSSGAPPYHVAVDDVSIGGSDPVEMISLGNSSSAAPTEEWPHPELLKQSVGMISALATMYGLVFLMAIINNSLVLTAIYRTHQLHTVTNMFLANLAVADITVSVFVLPITLLNNLFTGKYHQSHCSATSS